MLHMVLRQRRRFAFALILTQIAFWGVWPQSAIFGVMMLGICAGILLVAASGHPIRRLIECGAVGVLAASRMPTPALIVASFLAGTAIAYALMYTRLLDRIPFRLGMRSRKTFSVNLDQRTTWNKLIPGQGHPAAYWSGSMLSARTDPLDDATLYVSFESADGPPEEITITYLTLRPYHSTKYLIERDTLLEGEELIMVYRLERVADEQTRILSDMRVSGLPVRHAVERFFDDVLGDELDSFATMTNCKRTWRLRLEQDVALTSELGKDRDSAPTADMVAANETTGEEEPVQHRMTA